MTHTCNFQALSQNCEKRLLASSSPRHGTTRLSLDRFSWEFIFWLFVETVERVQDSLQSDKNNGYFGWRL